MPEPLAYFQGRFVPQAQAQLPLHDAGFVFGATVTDLCRTFRHQLYRWPDHLRRFQQSCRLAFLEIPTADAKITDIANKLVAHNAKLLSEEQELALVLFATPGPVGYYLGETGGVGDGPVTFGMHTFPLPFARYHSLIRNGAHLVLSSIRQPASDCVDPRIKQRSRMHYWLADRERRPPGSTPLLLNDRGHITETAAANFLLIRDGVVYSPSPDEILSGISLGVVHELCAACSIPTCDDSLTPADCDSASEALLTSTPYCLAGVAKLQGRDLPFPGPILSKLLHAWNESVGLDIHRQVLDG